MWKGKFNWYGEVHSLSASSATSEYQAFHIMCAGLAKKLGRAVGTVITHYKYGTGFYEMWEEMK